jgi:hypothetical protein
MKRILKGILLFFVALTAISASFLLYLRHCDWNGEEAAKYATENALKKSVGLCAMYVRKAMIAGGIPLYQGGNAWHYKYLLPILGFEEVDKKEEKMVGDIVVFQPIGKRWFGHIAIWNGKQWVSDFKQRSIIVHSDYTKEECEYAIFRRDD